MIKKRRRRSPFIQDLSAQRRATSPIESQPDATKEFADLWADLQNRSPLYNHFLTEWPQILKEYQMWR